MLRRALLCLSLAILPLGLPGVALAVQPDEMLKDPVLEHRAREISSELRCLVCRNESIDDSDAALAHDLRVLVRQRLVAGDTDAQVIKYMTDRYGEYVLLRPEFNGSNLILWGAGPVLLLFGLGMGVAYARRHRGKDDVPPEALSAEEAERLKTLIGS